MNKQKCTYCLKKFPKSEITVDHVIARSWYPADTPPVRKWKAPCCIECNRQKSATEGKLLGLIALCLDPENKGEKPIIDKIFRSIDPKLGQSAKDSMHRLNKKFALLRQLKKMPSKHSPEVLPSFKENYDKGSRTGVLIPKGKLEELIQSWVRGIHLIEIGNYIDENATIDVYQVSDEAAFEAFKDIMQYAQIIEKGDGVRVFIWHAVENDKFAANYAFILYGKFKAYASVSSK
ncbi:HNH endonuclease signature motif containing protein [uncultured Sneathiella sp.]|uniref:HNH endonuclease n=1 Tax=uncultured Sneathiella sp. TaxID=879315 RepID=UPI0030EBEF83